MFSPQFASLRLRLLVSLLAFLTACSGNAAVESWFAPDPKLAATPQVTNSPPANPSPSLASDPLPPEIPLYPGATLAEKDPNSTADRGKTRWNSPAPSNLIARFYQEELAAKNWQILQPFPSEAGNGEATLMARQGALEVKVAIPPTSTTPGQTEFKIDYQTEGAVGTAIPTPPTTSPALTATTFSDLDRVPEALRSHVADLAALGVLAASQDNQFQPAKIITRREYARWLFAANNALYASVPSQQVRPGSATDQPAFRDVPASDADFPAIQGLAQAGLLPSSLTGNSSALLFRPNAPLTREDLIVWKVPLDNRKAPPPASIQNIKETWGFQDASKISPQALPALYADYQNGEQANVQRAFGYTTLFQPKKPVTRAEAAAALWYFGSQGEGMSAAEALQAKK